MHTHAIPPHPRPPTHLHEPLLLAQQLRAPQLHAAHLLGHRLHRALAHRRVQHLLWGPGAGRGGVHT